jgi:hypothetical protein
MWDLRQYQGNLYWMAISPNPPIIATTPSAGGPVKTLASTPIARTTLAVNGTGVYWVQDGGGAVMRTPLSGGAPQVIATSTAHPNDVTWVAVDDTSVYWTTWSAAVVHKATIATGEVTMVAAGFAKTAGIAIDEQYVYFSGNTDLMRAAKDGSGAEIMAQGDPPWVLAVDDKCVYWLTASGLVKKIAK